ncbi:MAG: hypothetical protein OCD02_10845 [Spirochaetaceae bacterium]
MEDIIEIYEPIYRETSKVLPITLLFLLILLIGIGLFFLFRYIKYKKSIITPEHKYKKCLDSFLILQNNIEKKSTHDFADKVSYLYKKYLTDLYSTDFNSTTAEEMIEKLLLFNVDNVLIKDMFINIIEPCQFGKLHINIDQKNITIKNCVDSITTQYNKKVNIDA